MKRIAIMNNGTLPIPSVLGGAVETLVQLLVDTNEKEKQMQLEILSIDNVNAREKAKEYFEYFESNDRLSKALL